MRYSPRNSFPVSVHVTEHCNQNCRYCSNFSSLADKEFLDVENFENDCKRLGELSDGELQMFKFSGGEPLLHPQLADLFDIAKKYLPKTRLICITNGTLLAKQNEKFWKNCAKNDIVISISIYPENQYFDKIKEWGKKYGVKFSINKKMNEWYKLSLDLQGKQKGSFKKCSFFNNSICLENGKLYTCCIIPYIRHFNRYFGKELEVTENDYIDIHNVKDIAEISEFLCREMSFCRYCSMKNIKKVEWGISKKEITEWT
jgi:MoaA/NifB/PqqE/SkfB family radical SAM enzyme